ncbi:hypothetical protein Tco_1131648 [Tanacetum coccineum]
MDIRNSRRIYHWHQSVRDQATQQVMSTIIIQEETCVFIKITMDPEAEKKEKKIMLFFKKRKMKADSKILQDHRGIPLEDTKALGASKITTEMVTWMDRWLQRERKSRAFWNFPQGGREGDSTN